MPAKVLLLLVVAFMCTTPAFAYANPDTEVRDVYRRDMLVCRSAANAIYVYSAAKSIGVPAAQSLAYMLGCGVAPVAVIGSFVRRCEAMRHDWCGRLPISSGMKWYYGIIFPKATDAAVR